MKITKVISLLTAALMAPANCQTFTQGLKEKQIFHGTSLIVRPDYDGRIARNATATAASFYCYFGLTGYLSFGWWLPASPDADVSKCVPDNKAFDWFEYTTSQVDCTTELCRVHMKNFDNLERPDNLFMEEDYVFSSVPLGKRRMEQLGWGYFDRDDGAFAFGTRRILGKEHGSQSECERALQTLREVQEQRNLTELGFGLGNVCGAHDAGAQIAVLGDTAL